MSNHNLFDQRQSFLLAPSSTVRGGLIFCVLVGVVTFVAGLAVADAATRTWGSFLFNCFWFFSIALGGIAFAGMQDVISAKWGRPVMRLHESFASFLPVGAGLFALFFLCIALHLGKAHEVYEWIRDPHLIAEDVGKRDWLRPGFMIGRDLFALVLIMLLAGWQLKNKLGPDLVMMQGDQARAKQLGAASQARLRHWSAPVLVLYAVLFSLLAFDLTMSLAPKWYSTLWGGWSFAVMMQSLMAALLLFMYAVKQTPAGQLIKRQQFHDVGKLLHGFTIFFAYLSYSHILTYWYGNVPEETAFFLKRMQAPWQPLLYVVFAFVFIVPLFSLLPKVSKWTAGLTIPICFSILFAQWLMALLVVIPQTVAKESWSLPWVEVGMFLGFLGLFLSSVIWFGRRFPMVSLADPLLAEALADQH